MRTIQETLMRPAGIPKPAWDRTVHSADCFLVIRSTGSYIVSTHFADFGDFASTFYRCTVTSGVPQCASVWCLHVEPARQLRRHPPNADRRLADVGRVVSLPGPSSSRNPLFDREVQRDAVRDPWRTRADRDGKDSLSAVPAISTQSSARTAFDRKATAAQR